MTVWMKLLAAIAILAAIAGSYIGVYLHGVETEHARGENELLNERLTYAKAFDAGQAENDKIKTEGAKQHAKDTEIINNYRNEYAGFRLHLPPASCQNSGISGPASGSLDGNAGSGSCSEPAQPALDRFTAGLEQDAYDTEVKLNACRVVMTWARSLCKLNNTCAESR